MTSDSVSSFLDLARANRVLLPDLVEDLFRQNDVPQHNLASLCDFLLNRGVITAYQADLIKSGRGFELNFAGYPIMGEGPDWAGGGTFQALHPSLRTPVVIRRVRTDWLAPADNAAAYSARAQAAAPITHKHLANLLDSGAYRDELYAALDPVDGADLDTLVRDIGPMPAPLAASYILQAAAALQAAHEKFIAHGHVRPGVLFVSPLSPMSKTRPDGTPRMRPSSSAKLKLCDLGLTPLRPPLAEWLSDASAKLDPAAGLDYLPPERVDSPTFTASSPAGDIYGLGATLYFLLTGKPVFEAATNGDLLAKLRADLKFPLEALRPDAPPALTALVRGMLSKDPGKRPPASAVVDLLSALALPVKDAKPAEPAATAAPAAPVDLAVVPGEGPVDLALAGPGGTSEVMLLSGEGETPTQQAPDHVPAHGYPAPGYDPTTTPQHVGWPAAYPDPQAYPETNYGWGSTDAPAFGPGAAADPATPSAPRPPKEPEPKGNLTMWLILGGTCHILACIGIAYLLFFSGGTEEEPKPKPKPPKVKKNQ